MITDAQRAALQQLRAQKEAAPAPAPTPGPAPAIEDGPGKTERYARSAVGETVGGTLGALPGLSALAQGAFNTMTGVNHVGEDAGTFDKFMGNVVLDRSGNQRWEVGAIEWANDVGSDVAEYGSDDYKRDLAANPGEEGYVPADEELVGAIVSMILPVGWIGKAGKAGQLATKAGAAVDKMPRAAKIPLKITGRTAELMAPGAMGTTAKGYAGSAAANAAVGGTLTEGMRAATGLDTVTEFLEEPLGGANFEDDDGPSMVDVEQASMDAAAAGTQSYPDPAYTMTVQLGMEADEQAQAEQDVGLGTQVGTALGVIGGTGLAVGGLRALRTGKANRTLQKAAQNIQDLETVVADSTVPLKSSIRNEVTEKLVKQGVSRAEAEKLAETQAREYDAVLRTHVGAAGDTEINQGIELGNLDNFGQNRVRTPWKAIERMYYTAPKDLQKRFLEAMNDADRLEMVKAATVPQSLQAKRAIDVQRLGRQVARHEADPELAPMMKTYREYMQDMSDYRYRKGMTQYDQWQRERGRAYYVPRQYEYLDDRSFVMRAMDDLFKSPDKGQWLARNEQQRLANKADEMTPEQYDNLLTDNRLDAVAVGRRYTETIMRNVRQNDARLDYLRRMDGTDMVQRVQNPKKYKDSEIISVNVAGSRVHYRVQNEAVRNALEFRPHAVVPLLNSMRKLSQAGTTGWMQPAFALKSILYNATMGMLTARNRDGYSGLLDSALDQFMRSKGWTPETRLVTRDVLAGVLRPIDATLAVGEGLARGLNGQLKQMQAQRLVAQLGIDPQNAAQVQAVQEVVDRFYDTTYGRMLKLGHMSSRLDSDPTGSQTFKMLDGLIAKMAAQHELPREIINGYRGLLSAFKDAYHVGIFARNWEAQKQISIESLMRRNPGMTEKQAAARVKLTKQQQMNVATFTRDIASDPSKAGTSAGINKALSAINYGNITMQSTVHLLRSMNNPAMYSTLATAVAASMWGRSAIQMLMGQEALDDYYARTPEWEQMEGVPMPMPDGTIATLPLGYELGTLVHTLGDSLYKLLGASTEMQDMLELEKQNVIMQSLARLAGIMTPASMDALAVAFTGKRFDIMEALALEESQRDPLKNSAKEEMRFYGGNAGVMTDQTAEMFGALFGSVGAMMANAIEISFDNPENYDDGFFTSLMRSFGQLPSAIATEYNERARKDATIIYDALPWTEGRTAIRDSTFTPLSQKVYEVSRGLEEIQKHDLQRQAGANGRKSNPWPVDMLGVMPAQIKDPVIRQQVQQVYRHFRMTNRRNEWDRIRKTTATMETIKANRTGDITAKNKRLNELNQRVQDNYELLLDGWGEFETMMREQFGDTWSLTRLAQDIDRDLSGRVNR